MDTPVRGEIVAHIWRSDAAVWYDPKEEIRELPEGIS